LPLLGRHPEDRYPFLSTVFKLARFTYQIIVLSEGEIDIGRNLLIELIFFINDQFQSEKLILGVFLLARIRDSSDIRLTQSQRHLSPPTTAAVFYRHYYDESHFIVAATKTFVTYTIPSHPSSSS
jgi:hypothetical protein